MPRATITFFLCCSDHALAQNYDVHPVECTFRIWVNDKFRGCLRHNTELRLGQGIETERDTLG
jgi:hypothetical protein